MNDVVRAYPNRDPCGGRECKRFTSFPAAHIVSTKRDKVSFRLSTTSLTKGD